MYGRLAMTLVLTGCILTACNNRESHPPVEQPIYTGLDASIVVSVTENAGVIQIVAKEPISCYGEDTQKAQLTITTSQPRPVLCTATCGNGVCEGSEQAGEKKIGSYCPEDCGCVNNFVWSKTAQTCVFACPTVSAQYGGEQFVVSGCGTRTEHSTPIDDYSCEGAMQCLRCESGLYLRNNKCEQIVYGDGVCRNDFGEPLESVDCS